jgi:hypothetical protein
MRRLATNLGLLHPAKAFNSEYVARRDGRPTGARPPAGASDEAFELLGSAAGSTARYPESLRYFARGYNYAQRLPVSAPDASSNGHAPAGNPLEAYFDAYTEGPGIWKWRHYFDIYDRHLSRFRGQPVRIVEIGIFGGGSIGMWREYFGPDTHIYGVDIDPSCRALAKPGVEIFIGDQADPAFWAEFLATSPTIDIVLDDGGHAPDQQMVTLECLLPAIRPGGVFICEDIHGAFQPFHAFVDGITHPLSGIGFGKHATAGPVHQHVESVHRYPLVTVIEKPAAPRQRFQSERHGTSWPGAREPSEED